MVQQMCDDSRDPTLVLDPMPLLRALNLCLPRADRFPVGQSSCLVEALTQLLEQLPLLAGQVTTFQEQAQCGLCGQVVEQVGLVSFLCYSTVM